MWTRYFKRVFVINLPGDTARMEKITSELNQYGIVFERVEGILNPDGEQGIMDTMMQIWSACQHLDNILVFEDDAKCVLNPNLVMDQVVNQLRKMDWHLFYMGPNTHRPFKEFVTRNILRVEEAYGLHATAYSRAGMKEILKRKMTKPIDVSLAAQIQTLGKSYCCYPLLVTQNNGYSNIQKKNMDQGYIEQRYYDNVRHLVK